MKKILVSLAAVAFVALMITNVYAIIEPPTLCDACPGFTPGFWKHNIHVRLGMKLDEKPFKGAYSAFERDGGAPYYFTAGTKLTNEIMDNLLADINDELDNGYTFMQLLGYLYEPGWSTDRTNTANWFNWAAGYAPYNG